MDLVKIQHVRAHALSSLARSSGVSTIHPELGTGDIRRGIRCEKQYAPGDLLRFGEAFQRGGGGKLAPCSRTSPPCSRSAAAQKSVAVHMGVRTSAGWTVFTRMPSV